MYEGYLVYGGNEVINNARTFAYATALGIATPLCGPCPTLLRAVGDPQGYTTPAADDAPWYDPVRPESAGFAGLLGLRVDGVTDGVTSQQFTDTADGRAIPGAVRAYSREVQVVAELLATDEAAMSYGRSWLAAVLRGERCAPGCAGTELCGFTCCPPDCPLPDEGQPDTCGDAHWRTMQRVGVIVPPRKQRIRTTLSGVLCQMDFTFRAGDPYLWNAPVLLAKGPAIGQQLADYTDSGLPPDCGDIVDCVRDPLCPPPPAPLLPAPVTDLCYPTGEFTARRWVIELPSGLTPAWHEKVPYVRINPGSLDLRRLRLRWFRNPLGRPCADLITDPCGACMEVQVPYLPRNAWFVMDGRVQQATVDCPGGPGLSTGDVPVYGPGGSPFTWPTFGCDDVPTCLEIVALASSVSPDARWEISTVVREEAS